MKRLLLFLLGVLVSIGIKAGSATITSWDGTALVIDTNGDADLETIDENTEQWGANIWGTSWYNNSYLKIVGDISQNGLDKIQKCMLTKSPSSYVHGLNLVEANVIGEITAIPTTVSFAVLPKGISLENMDLGNASYVYSAPGTDNVANLYANTVERLADILNLEIDALKKNNTKINISGNNRELIKDALINAGLSADNINIVVPIDRTTCYIYHDSQSVESVVKQYLQDNVDIIENNRIRRIMFVAGDDDSKYKLTSSDINYMKELNVGILNMANASYDESITWDFPNSVEELIMPKGDAISHAEFGDLKNCLNLKYAVDGDFTRLYLPNQTEKDGVFTQDLLSEVPTDIVNSVQGVAISGPINVDDFNRVNKTFKNATMFNLYSATLADGKFLKDYGETITTKPNGTPVDFVAPANTKTEELETLSAPTCQCVGCAYSVLDDGTFYIYIKDGARHNLDIAKYESEKTKRAIFVNGNEYEGQGTATNVDVIEALNATRKILSVDFSQVPMADKNGETTKNTDEILSGLSSEECGIKFVILPSTCTITKSIYDSTPVEVVVRRSNDVEIDQYGYIPMEVYHRKAGHLASLIEGVTEVEDRVDVTGIVNGDDIAALKSVPGRRINLAECEVEEGTDLSALTFAGNENVEYALLPNGIQAVDETMFSGCTNFKSACSFYDSDNDNQLDAVSAYVKESGSLATTVALGYSNCYVDFLKHATMSGNLNGADITKNGTHDIQKDGSSTDKLTGALQNSALETLDLSKATFANYKVKLVPTVTNTSALETGYTEYTNGLSEISSHANTLKELKLPETDGTTFLPNHSIYKCASLTTLIVPDNINELGSEAINSCSGLTSLQINGVRTLNLASLSGNTSLTNIMLPVGLTNISAYCFSGCKALKELRVPEGVKTIGASAFDQLAITAISLPSSLERIEEKAFQQCLELTSITIPANVEYIGSNAFFNCTKLKDVYVLGDGTKPIIEYDAFSHNHLYGGGTGVVGEYVKTTSSEEGNVKGYAEDKAYYERENNRLTFFHFPVEHADKYTMPERNAAYEYIAVTDLSDCENTKVTEVSWNSKNGEAEYKDDYYLRRPSNSDLTAVQNAYSNAQGESTDASVSWWKYFALVDAYDTGNDNSTVWTVRHIKDDTWYTMCMPFDITYDQMTETFNVGYELAYFAGVKQSGNDIVLDFTLDYDKDKTDNIAAYAGIPYMIHPNRGIEAGTNTAGSHTFVISGVSPDLSVGPYPVTSGGEHVSNSNGYLNNYEFIGSYGVYNESTGTYEGDYEANVVIPYGYYFLGLKSGETWPRFYKETSKDDNRETGRWTRFTACVRMTDDSGDANQSLGISFGDAEPNTTVVTRIIDVNGTIVDEQRIPAKVYGNNVYDINGRMVRLGTTSLEGLSKGVYIVNGKKVSVK